MESVPDRRACVEIYAGDNSTSPLRRPAMIITMGMIYFWVTPWLRSHGPHARVSELMLLDGQNYVYLRHVYMERPRPTTV